MISGKGIILLQNIIENNGEKSIKDLSNELEIGERTVRYEIEKIEEYLNDNYEIKNISNIELTKGTVKITDIQIVKNILKENYSIKFLSSEEREIYILLQILFKRSINQGKLSEKLDISRNTLKLYLKNIKDLLGNYNLKLEISPKKGLILIGEEENIRLCTLNFFGILKSSKNYLFKEIIENEVFVEEDGIVAFMNYCQKLMNRIVSDEAFEIIKKYLKIAIVMAKNGNSMRKIKNENFLEETEEYKAVKKASALIESNYDIEFSKVEYLKITDFFLGSHTYNHRYSYYENWVEMEVLVKKLIQNFNKRIDVDISKDDILLDGLLNHLKPTIYRIQNGIQLENSIYLEVIESYPNLFKITKEVMNELERYIEKDFSDDEIAFITIHFKASMDRNRVIIKNKKKVLLVCGMGYGTSKLLAQQLKELFSIDIIDIIPKHMLTTSLNKNEIDVIITTVDLKLLDFLTPVIKVNPILSTENINILKKSGFEKRNKKYLLSEFMNEIEKNCTINDKENMIESLKNILNSNLIDDISPKKITIFDMLNKKQISLGEIAKDWEEAVRKAGNLLLKSGCVEESYVEDMVQCIKNYGSYMVMGKNIAFPHAKTDSNVNKTAFSIVTLKNSVLFPEDIPVKTIIAFSSKDNKEHLDGFLEIVEEIEKPEFNMEKFVKKF
ncbi:BglG family transcription antiterminator [Cetobacterium sp. 2G large]|uniref:BglG family transcription antiterminator n=1 Tax=Cetobacterium sp. 2G large TaxID=2759680 RepID=UPI00163C3522|nr:BglG family transcription antiterminator [Cetobacterium sp. 2G large]MBC2854250.1 BglG family transcription antiterminator [Cetobacterium sp. 2G large]